MAKKKGSVKKEAAPVNNQTTTSSDKDATQKVSRETSPMAEPVSTQTTTSSGKDATQKVTRETLPPPSRDPSPDKTERLKQLNDILLKQTLEKREQVSQLQSQVEEMSFEFKFTSETERDFMNVILSTFVINLGITMNEKLREVEAENRKEAERGRELEAMVDYLKEEAQAGVEKTRLAEEENTLILTQLRGKEKEVLEMGNTVKELEKVRSEMETKFLKVSGEKETLVREGIEKEGLIGNLRTEKKEVETNLDECKKLVEKLEIKVEEEVKDKELKVGLLKNEKEALEVKIVSLEQDHVLEIQRFSSAIEGMKQTNAEKEGEIRDLKATIDEEHEKIAGLEKEIDILQLAVVDANKKSGGGFWSWIYPAATTILAAISFIYAARAR